MNLARIPAWLRWALYAAVGVLVLTTVQGFDETDNLTAAGSSQSMLRWAVPILLAGLGGLFSERAGVVNIGLEGMMILGTWFGAWGAVTYGPWWGVLLAVAGGAMGGLLHAIATVSFGVDHVISGVAVNILAPGITRFLSSEIFTTIPGGSITQSPRVPPVGAFTLPFLSGGTLGTWQTPDFFGWLAGRDIFLISDLASLAKGLVTRVSWISLIALLLVPFTAWLLWRTRFGLRLRICGERPEAGEAQGINVYRYKYIGVVISGALAGLAGAFIVSPELSGIYLEGQNQRSGFHWIGGLDLWQLAAARRVGRRPPLCLSIRDWLARSRWQRLALLDPRQRHRTGGSGDLGADPREARRRRAGPGPGPTGCRLVSDLRDPERDLDQHPSVRHRPPGAHIFRAKAPATRRGRASLPQG